MIARTRLTVTFYVQCLSIRSVLTSTNQTLGSCVRTLVDVNISLVPSVSVLFGVDSSLKNGLSPVQGRLSYIYKPRSPQAWVRIDFISDNCFRLLDITAEGAGRRRLNVAPSVR